MIYLIPFLILLPLAAGVTIFLAGKRSHSLVGFGVAASAVTLIMSIGLAYAVYSIEPTEGASTIAPRIVFEQPALHIELPISANGHPIRWQLLFGADGVGALMVLLTGIVGFVTILLATTQIEHRQEKYIALMLISMSMLMGVFLSMDLVSFYVFFEAVLIPLILLINGWGNRADALQASRKFLIFTLAGSIPMVIGLIALAMQVSTGSRPSTISIVELSQITQDALSLQLKEGLRPTEIGSGWVVWLLLLGFGIKLAILPLHSWLPATYASAHPNTTAFIASVVAKLGLFGIIRIVIPLTPVSLSQYAQYLFGGLGALAIVYGAMVALSQTDMRRVLAFSSISHVGFITLGLMTLNSEGIAGATIQMFNHGLITASMFLILATLEQRRGSVSLADQDRGMAAVYPKIGVLLVFFTLAGAGLPGLNGFVGELLAMWGMMRVSGLFTGIAVLGTVLGAWYGLRIVQRLMFGSDGHTKTKGVSHQDLSPVEWAPLAGIALVCLWIGLNPQQCMQLFNQDVTRLVKLTEPVSKYYHPEIDTLAKK